MAQQQIATSTFESNLRARPAALFTLAIALTVLASVPVAQAQNLTVLYNFTGRDDGDNPYAGITFEQGRIYGTTYAGGYQQNGVVYRGVREGAGWIFTPIYTFRGPD